MNWLKNAWYVALWSQDLKANEIVHRQIIDQGLVLFRAADGSPVALHDRCPHRFAPLSQGQLCDGGNSLRCGYHGLEFDRAGQCVRNPHGSGRIVPGLTVRSYPVVEKHTLVWVWMGDQAPNYSKIPDYSLLDDADVSATSARDYLRMEVDYRLIIDNLLDLSHVSFLHDGILGNDETVEAAIELEEGDRTVKVSRHMPDVTPPGLFDMLYKRDAKPVDLWAAMRWTAPSCLLNDAGVTAVGDTRANGTGIFGVHLLTPESARSTLYHFVAVRQNPLPFPDNEKAEIVRKLSEMRRMAFVEQDSPMIQGQQAIIDRDSVHETLQPVLLSIDAGPVRARRILDQLIAAESDG